MHRLVRMVARPVYRAAIGARRRARAAVEERALRRRDPHAPLRIVVGADGIAPPGWFPTEAEFLDLREPRGWRRHFAPGAIQAILAEHVWHFLTPDEARAAASLCFEYLAPGGRLRVAVPDGFHPDPAYVEWVRPGGSARDAHLYRVLYTCRTLGALFEDAGFSVRLLEYHDETGRFHASPWDPQDGLIHRSSARNRRQRPGVRRYTSLILDAAKPVAPGAA